MADWNSSINMTFWQRGHLNKSPLGILDRTGPLLLLSVSSRDLTTLKRSSSINVTQAFLSNLGRLRFPGQKVLPPGQETDIVVGSLYIGVFN